MEDFEDKIYYYPPAPGSNANGDIYSISKNAQVSLNSMMMSHGAGYHMPASWAGGYSGGHAAVWTGIQGSHTQYFSSVQAAKPSKHNVLNVVIRSIMFHIASCLHEAGLLYELSENASYMSCQVAITPTDSIIFSAEVQNNECLVAHVRIVNGTSSYSVANSATYYDESAVDCPKLLEVLLDKFNVKVEGRISSESTFQYMDDMLRRFIHAVQENPTGEDQSVGRTAL